MIEDNKTILEKANWLLKIAIMNGSCLSAPRIHNGHLYNLAYSNPSFILRNIKRWGVMIYRGDYQVTRR
jgi:hypothetical protein